ncbi:hypothetical protein D3C76_1401450 [compost metagenome]
MLIADKMEQIMDAFKTSKKFKNVNFKYLTLHVDEITLRQTGHEPVMGLYEFIDTHPEVIPFDHKFEINVDRQTVKFNQGSKLIFTELNTFEEFSTFISVGFIDTATIPYSITIDSKYNYTPQYSG